MYTSEDVNTAALYNLHYTGAAKKTQDSQEQYEALLNSWGFNPTKPSTSGVIIKTASTFFRAVRKALKSSFNMVSATALISKKHSASAHIPSH
ncbi:hypothetical protein MGA5115_03245 [Marinomonas gallaica]|uniref:Uncharacterized protein n=1 Tax=Marinomonas gallaica TaxID=1806667 RepID=A0A1C3JV25_9GAMM|nr:hypothetical protein [Marinomonas gallaica]SBT19084.1 hypothetical protein MGA5115_03245 [Marinomonas gallaica]SBT20841.1 hypothetical protein MGA5116_01428 [Marinomonas gallaica]